MKSCVKRTFLFIVRSKKEGAFCVWTKEELTQLLPKADSAGRNAAEIFFAAFGVKSDGNVNPAGDPHGELRGKNVLTRVGSKDEELVTKFGLRDLEELEQVLISAELYSAIFHHD